MRLQHKIRLFALTLLLSCILTACKGGTEGPFTSPLPSGAASTLVTPPLSLVTPIATLQPEAEKATVTGRVLSRSTGAPVVGVAVRLAEVYWREGGKEDEGIFVLDDAFSPGTLTDEYGRFVIKNIEPKEYVVVVGNVSTLAYEIISDSSGKARVWNIPADQVFDMGDLRVGLRP